MSWNTTFLRLRRPAALALGIPACGGSTGGTVAEPSSSDDPAILKLSYFRAFPDGKSKRLECFFRCVMSESWKDRHGRRPPRGARQGRPGRVYMGYVADVKMSLYLKKLREFGLDDLQPCRTEDLKPDEFGRLALNQTETSFTRVFTVGDEKGSRSYYYRHQWTGRTASRSSSSARPTSFGRANTRSTSRREANRSRQAAIALPLPRGHV
jgi:hypothetical protein